MTKKTTPKGNTYPFRIQSHNKIAFILLIFVFLLYANTLGHDYALDDAIVITENQFTQQGISGFPGILNKDTFFGYFKEEGKAQLVSGGRYRPFTLLLFAVEVSFFGQSPWIGHLMNILWYGATVILLYFLLLQLFRTRFGELAAWIALLAAAVFAAHPVHTEAVANIKGRDEICSLFFSLLAMWWYLKAFEKKKLVYYILAAVSLFIGLLSKENAITFVAVIPLSMYFFRNKSFSGQITGIVFLMVPAIAFIAIRTAVIGQLMSGEPPMELMNNPFLKLEGGRYIPLSFQEKYATIVYTLGKYIQLLFWPFPLTHDYYPRQIGILNWGHPGVLASVAIYAGGFIAAVKGWNSKSIFSFAFLYFVLTLSIVSNLVFPVGTNMSERFLFMPSVGFVIWIAVWLVQNMLAKRMDTFFYGISGLVIIVFSILTIGRNPVWKDNASLFLTDVHTSNRSAKLQNAAGGEKIRLSNLEGYESQREILLKEAIEHLKQAIQIHPAYKNAWLLMGNAFYYSKDYEQAIESFDRALQLDPGYKDALTNKGITLRDAGRFYGEQLGDLPKALQFLSESLRYLPEDYEANRLMGVASGISGDAQGAVQYFEKAAELLPENADAWLNLAAAYRQAGQLSNAESATERALSIDPDAIDKKQNR